MASSPVNISGKPPDSKFLSLMQLGGMTFSITSNAGWYDYLTFPDPLNTSKPLDISGIDFHAELRVSVDDANNRLDMRSDVSPPQLVVDDQNGTLFFSVDVSLIKHLPPGPYMMDILAIDHNTGMVRNLCEGGPIVVTIIHGVTR